MVPVGGNADAILQGYYDQVVAWDRRLQAAQARAWRAAEAAAALHEIDAAAEAVLWRAEANELALKQYVSSLARRKEHVAAAMAAGEHVLERVFVAAGTVADARARSRRFEKAACARQEQADLRVGEALRQWTRASLGAEDPRQQKEEQAARRQRLDHELHSLDAEARSLAAGRTALAAELVEAASRQRTALNKLGALRRRQAHAEEDLASAQRLLEEAIAEGEAEATNERTIQARVAGLRQLQQRQRSLLDQARARQRRAATGATATGEEHSRAAAGVAALRANSRALHLRRV